MLDIKGKWTDIKNAARTTIGLDLTNKEPNSKWKKQILLCEHSPIRKLWINWKWKDLKSWISVHFVRHKYGIEHFVKTQRTDRTGINRDDLPQSNLVNHECDADAQAIINISRKRLCSCASKETRETWQEFLNIIVKPNEPELYSVCVPECIYRGWCFEFESCGFFKTDNYKEWLEEYRNLKEE